MLSLARIPGLTSLNHTRITTKERTNAELYYLSQIAKELGSTDGTIEQETAALSLHPRWKTLCEIHGEPTIVRKEVGSASTDPNSLAGRLVTLTLQLHLEARKSSTNTTLTVPRTVSVYRLKSLIGTKVSVLPSRLKLIWETGEWDPVGRKVKGKRARGWVANDESSEEDEDDDRFSVGESDDENDENGRVEDLEGEGMGSWVKREVELEDGSRVLGSWVEGKEAVVRVETRRI